jgi:hypothetical protein
MKSLLPLALVLLVSCAPPEKTEDAAARPEEGSPVATATAPATDDERAVRDVVAQFGQRLRNVSLLGPRHVLESSIRREYAPYVTKELLDAWLADPAKAPGRLTSSPWPETIEIDDARREPADRWTVTGRIVESSSAGTPPPAPVRIEVARSGEQWRIASFASLSGSSAAGAPAEPEAEDAAAVIRSYHDAINAKEYERAYRLWEGDGKASGKSLDDFRAGFANTANVAVRTGPPGRIEGAAGSRYVMIPVQVIAKSTSGPLSRFEGKYSLRRSVVDGATPDQRQWRIASAKLKNAPSPK